jgi:hypothetical protein
MAADGGACIICLDTSPPPIQSGCACRGDSGLAHIACLVQAATSQQAQRGNGVWRQCQTCKQDYTGATQTGLAVAWRSQVAGHAAESAERIAAEGNLALSLLHKGKAVEAEPMYRRLHEVMMRVHGAEHRSHSLPGAAGRAPGGALWLFRTLLRSIRTRWRLLAIWLRPSHTKANTPTLSGSSSEMLGVQKRVLGAEHPDTLTTRSAKNLSMSLLKQGKYAEAERIQREVLGVQKRVLGAEHPDTLTIAKNLSMSLADQGKHVSRLSGSSAR